MPSIPFTCVLFDLDGTLVDTAPDLTGALNHVLKRNDLAPVHLEQVRDIVGFGARVIIERGFAQHGKIIEGEALDAAHKQFLEHYTANICEASGLYPGVEDVIRAFHSDGITLGVCTNKAEHLAVELLEQLRIADLFATICGSDTVPNRKPHPDHIHKALVRAGGDVVNSILIGDSHADVDAAKAAGIPVIAMSYGYTTTPPHELGADLVLDSFLAIPSALANWPQ